MEKVPGDFLAHYRLIEKVGEGGMGVVWKALDTTLGRSVAIKVLPLDLTNDRDRLARFEQEARTLAALNHPSIVTVYSVESADQIRFLTMEWVPGQTLDELIPTDGMPFSRFAELAVPLVGGIITAHRQGVTHRDLKPKNVMLTDSGRIKVLDFGLARHTHDKTVKSTSEAPTRSFGGDTGVAGTLAYMSPEQLRGLDIDQRSDIFSLGVLFFELLAARKPFHGDSVADLTASILRDEPTGLSELRPDLPVHLAWLVRRCLEKEPGKRFQTSGELLKELEVACGWRDLDETIGHSIAVLPFVDMSKDRDQAYFCEGIAEEVTSALTKIADLHVASRTSAFQFRALDVDPREVGRRLGVKTLLEGSVRKAGERLRITTELSEVQSGYTLWSETFDREMRDIFAIQDEIAERVAQALKVTLTPHERRAIRSVATANTEAYEYYLRGRRFLYQHDRRGIQAARQMFDHAIELDPTYALAHAGIADASSFVFLYVDRAPTYREQALKASQKALALDPELAQAHVSYGVAESLFDRSKEAIAAYQRALELDPDSFEAHFFYAREAFMEGDLEAATRLLERSCDLRPEDYQAPGLLGQVYVDQGRDDDARIQRRRCISSAEERLMRQPDDTRALYLSANAMVGIGEVERGLERARTASDLDPNDCMMLYNVGCIFSLAGRTEEALSFLERSAMVGNIQRRYYEQDSNLDALRGHQRYKALIAALEKRNPR